MFMLSTAHIIHLPHTEAVNHNLLLNLTHVIFTYNWQCLRNKKTLHTVRHVLVNIKLLLKIDNAATNQGNFTQNQTSWTTWPLASSCSVIPGSKYEILQSQTFIYSLWSQTTTIMHAIYIYIYIYMCVCVCVSVCVFNEAKI